MGSDESHFNVSLIVRDKVTRQCPQTTIFEDKGEPKRIRTEVPLLTSLTPYRYDKPARNLRLHFLSPLTARALRPPPEAADGLRGCPTTGRRPDNIKRLTPFEDMGQREKQSAGCVSSRGR